MANVIAATNKVNDIHKIDNRVSNLYINMDRSMSNIHVYVLC